MHNPSQRDVIAYCDDVTGGDPHDTQELYAHYDEIGAVARESNIRDLDSDAYANIIYHTAVKLGWI